MIKNYSTSNGRRDGHDKSDPVIHSRLRLRNSRSTTVFFHSAGTAFHSVNVLANPSARAALSHFVRGAIVRHSLNRSEAAVHRC